MKLHITGHVACLLLVCTIILQVYSAPLEDSTWQQPEEADSIKPPTVKPLGTRNVSQYQANNPHWDTKARTTTKEPDTESDSSHVSADVSKRSADGDWPNGNEDTEDSTADTTTENEEQDDASIEDTADDEMDTRVRRDAHEKRDERWDDEDNEDGGLTREAAVVAPIRRRRSYDNNDNTDVSTTEPANYDDTSPDTIEDTESMESTTGTLYRRRREAEASTVGTLEGSPVIVVAPSGIPAKNISKELDKTIEKLEQKIDSFEEAVIGQSTVPTVGVLAGDSTKEDNGTIIQTISSAKYIVH